MDGITEGWKIKTEKQEGSTAADFDLKYGLRFLFQKIHIPLFFLFRFINYIADVWDYKEKFDSMAAKNETSAKVIPKTISLRDIILQMMTGIATNVFRANQAPPRAG